MSGSSSTAKIRSPCMRSLEVFSAIDLSPFRNKDRSNSRTRVERRTRWIVHHAQVARNPCVASPVNESIRSKNEPLFNSFHNGMQYAVARLLEGTEIRPSPFG